MIDRTLKLATAAAKGAGDDVPRDCSVHGVGGQGASRVHVDRDASGAFLYRLVDVATGRVLLELPRERAAELKDHLDYAAAALVSSSA